MMNVTTPNKIKTWNVVHFLPECECATQTLQYLMVFLEFRMVPNLARFCIVFVAGTGEEYHGETPEFI